MCPIIRRCTVLLFAMTVTGLTPGSGQAQELTVLSNWFEFTDAGERFHHHLNDVTYAILRPPRRPAPGPAIGGGMGDLSGGRPRYARKAGQFPAPHSPQAQAHGRPAARGIFRREASLRVHARFLRAGLSLPAGPPDGPRASHSLPLRPLEQRVQSTFTTSTSS